MEFTARGPSPLTERFTVTARGPSSTAWTPAALIERCRSLDVRLWAEDGRLRFDAPKGALDDGLRSALAANKAALIDLLTDWQNRSQELQAEWERITGGAAITAEEIAEADEIAAEQMGIRSPAPNRHRPA